MNIGPWVACPKCSETLIAHSAHIVNYINQVAMKCCKCGENIDWWNVARQGIEDNFLGNGALSFVGAPTTLFCILLRQGQSTSYRFSDHGIPLGAKVLYVNYTPCGPLFPVEIHGNVSTVRFRADQVAVYPVPFGDLAPETVKVSVMVTWVPHGGVDECWQNLFDAFDAFVAGDYASVVVPANVAVESSLLHLMTAYFDKFVGKRKLEDFLTSAATYSHQLNVLLPTFAVLNGLPRLPQHVVGVLNRLRSLRNKLAHRGVPDASVSHKEAAEILCGALFGFHYIRFLQEKLCAAER